MNAAHVDLKRRRSGGRLSNFSQARRANCRFVIAGFSQATAPQNVRQTGGQSVHNGNTWKLRWWFGRFAVNEVRCGCVPLKRRRVFPLFPSFNVLLKLRPLSQIPALGRNRDEREQIRDYRKDVELAARAKLSESFDPLEKMDAIVTCGLGEQVEKLAAEYIRLKETGRSAVAVSQTWGEVHRINERVRKALKAKGFLGSTDTTVEAFDRLDLTNAQNRDERFSTLNRSLSSTRKSATPSRERKANSLAL